MIRTFRKIGSNLTSTVTHDEDDDDDVITKMLPRKKRHVISVASCSDTATSLTFVWRGGVACPARYWIWISFDYYWLCSQKNPTLAPYRKRVKRGERKLLSYFIMDFYLKIYYDLT